MTKDHQCHVDAGTMQLYHVVLHHFQRLSNPEDLVLFLVANI